MLQKFRQVFKRMNLDVDAMLAKPDEYAYLINGSQFESEGDGAIRSVLGNRLITNSDLGAGTNRVIGRYEDTLNNRVIYFLYNSTGNHCIYVLKDDNTIAIVLKWSGLNFDLNYPINGVVMYGDILIWCDGAKNELRKINVATGLASGYTSLKEQHITLIKAPPILPLLLTLSVDGSYPNNYIKDNSFQFYYRFYYDDNEVSVWSATSKVILHSNNKLINKITVAVDASDPSPAHVTKIEFAYRLGNSNEFIVYRTSTNPAGPQTHAFYNDQNGPTVPDTESFKWNDAVPLRANALEMIKNRLFLFNYLENYAKTQFVFSAVSTPPVYTNQTIYTDGTYFYWKNPDDGSYYGVDYNGGTDTAITPSTGGAPLDRADALPVGATTASSTATVNGYFGISVFHGGSKYKVGIMFFDTWGRQNGAYTNGQSINFPAIFPIPLPFVGPVPTYSNWIKWDFTALSNTVIPTWATSYAIVRTKALDKSFFIQDITADVFYYGPAADGTVVYAKDLVGSKAVGVAIDISNLTRNKIGYTFNAGDKITINFPTYGYRTFNIFSQDGKFINILDLLEFSPLITLSATDPTQLTYEIFTPIKALDQYYEVGEKHAITSPGTGGRAFSQLIGYLKGDVKIILRAQAVYLGGGSYSPTLPYNNVLTTPGGGHAFEAMNPADQYFDQWVQDTGRGIAELPYVIPQQKQNHLRWSGVYVQDSLINALSTFDAFDEYTLPKENGPGTALKKNDRVLVALHQKEASAVYIGEGFVNTSDANRFLAKTENVVGADNKYIGGFGTINPESVIVYADRTYYYDAFKATFIRRASDGLVAISDYGVRNFIKKKQGDFGINLQIADPANLRVFGGYDPKLEVCLWTFVYIGTVQFTVAFHEPTNSWIGFFNYNVEQYSRINGILLSFKDGNVWKYDNPVRNNFNGVQYSRLLEFNHGGQKVNVWKNIALDADEIWTDDSLNGTVVSLTDNGVGYVNSGNGQQLTRVNFLDIVKREGVFRSAIFKNVNTQLKGLLFDLLAPTAWTADAGTLTLAASTFTKNPVPVGSGVVATMYQPLVANAGQFVLNFSVLVNGLVGSLAVDFYPTDAGGFSTGGAEYNRTTTFETTDNGVLINVRAVITITAPTVRLYIKLVGVGISGTPSVVIYISPKTAATVLKYQGNPLRSQILKTQIVCNRTDAAALRAVEIGFTPSEVS